MSGFVSSLTAEPAKNAERTALFGIQGLVPGVSSRRQAFGFALVVLFQNQRIKKTVETRLFKLRVIGRSLSWSRPVSGLHMSCQSLRLVACYVPTLRLGLPCTARRATYCCLASRLTKARQQYVFNRDLCKELNRGGLMPAHGSLRKRHFFPFPSVCHGEGKETDAICGTMQRRAQGLQKPCHQGTTGMDFVS